MDASSFLSLLPGGKRALGINQLLAKVENYLPPEQIEHIRQAYEFGAAAHRGQKRLSGEPYISHPVAAANILADLHMDGETIIAAILHDVIEDTPTAKEQIAEQFGREVAELVDGVTKLEQIQFKSREEAQAESFRKMLLAMARDIRVILVKLADRTHNMRTLEAMPLPKRRAISRETLDIYAPIAERLGLYGIKLELEELGFKTLYPQRYRVIQRELKRARGNQKQFVGKIEEALRTSLVKGGIAARVEGREKHLYSVYKKMRKKGVQLNEVVDVYGFRIVVDTPDTCYRALGAVHGLYKPMPGRFKDYIAIPRANGYQSLHTTLFGPNGIPLEVQIRTDPMHTVAETGIAAHWRYKTDEKPDRAGPDQTREWLNQLVQMQEGEGNSEEFLESVKVDLFPDQVYVFTPQGKILRLPRGATAVDFAYAVHTDVGNHSVAAKVDRRIVPLRAPLRNGQTVEIITNKDASPNPVWVNFVVSAKARSAIRHYLKNLKHSEAVDLGKRLLNQALSEFSLTVKKIPEEQFAPMLKEFGMQTLDEVYEKIGLGERLAPLIARRLLPEAEAKAASAAAAAGPQTQAPLVIEGTEGLVVSYARCCFPIPNDPIMAYLSSGRGVVIHRESCRNLAGYRKQPDKWLSVSWEKNISRLFNSEIKLEIANKTGVLAAVAAGVAGTDTNIAHVSLVERDAETSTLVLELQVKNRKHLAQVVKMVRAMPDVIKVRRTIA